MLQWLIDNKEWLFGGAGVAVVAAVAKVLFSRRSPLLKQKQSGGKDSVNIQVGGNLKIDQGRKGDGPNTEGR